MSGDRKRERVWEYLRETGRPSLLRHDTREVQWAISKIRSYNARGMSLSAMADQVGLAQDAVTRLLRPGQPGIRRSTFEKIRQIEFDGTDGQRAQVPFLGAQRRLQALRADGFPYTFLCDEMGHARNSPRLQRIITGSKGPGHPVRFIIASTARQIESLYEKLAGVDPRDLGVSDFAVAHSRSRAARFGWPPSSCWDLATIDDPASEPEWTGFCGTPAGRMVHERDGIPVCPRCADAKGKIAFSGRRLRELRTSRGWSQKNLEEAVGIGKGHVNHWENGRYAPRPKILYEVLSVLDATFEDVCEESENT